MSDDDLVRRRDVLQIILDLTEVDGCFGDAYEAIAALPAVTAPQGVDALIEEAVWAVAQLVDKELEKWGFSSGPDGFGRRAEMRNVIVEELPSVKSMRVEMAKAKAEALAPAQPAPGALHRSFPEAGDGRPMSVMGDALMTAGLSAEDARFVAVQLEQNGWTLTPTAVDDSQAADPAVNVPEYTLAPNLQSIVEGAKNAHQWDTAKDRMATPDPDEAAKNRQAYKVGVAVGKASALREAENALRDWQDDLNANRMPETAVTIGMAADVVAALKRGGAAYD